MISRKLTAGILPVTAVTLILGFFPVPLQASEGGMRIAIEARDLLMEIVKGEQ